ncbi:MAG: AcrR family transcriptional regulator [Flavobacteriales bacterium]|jgi:AcrR family transcriptional regulator
MVTTARMSEPDRRAHLLAFGRQHFAEHAFDALPMVEIAKRAGVSKALLYRHFDGRRGFYLACIEAVADEVIAVTAPPEAHGVFLDELHTMLSKFVRYARDNEGIYLALVRGGIGADEDVRRIVASVRETSLSRILARIDNAKTSPIFRLALLSWLSALEHGTAAWLEKQDVSEHEVVGLFVSMLGAVLTQYA